MKTKVLILTIALLGLLMAGCSTSMQLSKSAKHQSDDLYYSPSGNTNTQVSADASGKKANETRIDLEELEKKYYDILAKDSTGSIDTVIYKAENARNPRESILSESYYDSYQRRMEARRDGYGSNFIYNYDEYWYARTYDPSYYNIIVYGDHIWVEPYYISAMFSWPRYRHSYYSHYSYTWPYWGFYPWGFTWSYGWGYSPYYWGNPFYGGYYGHYGWNSYAWGYNSGYWDGYYSGNQGYTPSYHYGRRPTQNAATQANASGTFVSESASINQTQRHLATRQPVFGKENNSGQMSTSGTLSAQNVTTTKPLGQEITRDNGTRPNPNTNNEGQIIVREPNKDVNTVTRPSRESLNVNPTRIKPQGDTDSRTGESYSPSYTRPKPGNSNEFNRPTRNYPVSEPTRSSRENLPAATPRRESPSNNPSRTYTPPSRVSNPAPEQSAPSRNSNSGSSNVSSPTQSSSPSSAPSRSSSGGSSGSSSGSGSTSGSRTGRTK